MLRNVLCSLTAALWCASWLPAAASADVQLADPHKTYIVVSTEVRNSLAIEAPGFGHEVQPAAVASLLGDADIGKVLDAQESPIGGHILFRVQGWAADQAGETIYLYACADSWVMRTDGTQLTRVTRACQSTSNYLADFHTGVWLPNGSIFAAFSYSQEHRPPDQFAMEVATDEQGTDHWNRRDLPSGTTSGFTPDGRYFYGSGQIAGSGSMFQWWAVDATTNQAYVLWRSGPSGIGAWTDVCSDATPARQLQTNEVTASAVLAALTGPDPACTFAKPAATPPLEPTVTPANTDTPTPTIPLATTTLVPTQPGATAPNRSAQPGGITVTAVTTRRSLAIRRGLRVTFSSGGSAAKVWVLLLGDDGAATQVLARGTVKTSNSAGATTFALSRKARQALGRSVNANVLVRVSGTGSDGKPAKVERTFTLAG